MTAVGNFVAETAERLPDGVGGGEIAGGPGSVPSGQQLLDMRRWSVALVADGSLPNCVQVEAQDKVGVQRQPALFVVGNLGPQDIAQRGDGDRQIQVVIYGIGEPLMQLLAGR